MSQRRNSQHVTSKWEWVAAAISGLIVIGMLVVLIRDAVAETTAPDIVLRVDSISRESSGYLVSFTAVNHGTRTAATLGVSAELRVGDTVIESSSTTIDYVPGKSERGGGLILQRDPHSLRLELRALGYEDP